VFEASDKNAAIAHLNKRFNVHALLLDLELTAWDVIARHALALAPHTYVLGMAYPGALPAERDLKSCGVRDYFFKPILYTQLRSTLSQAMGAAIWLACKDRDDSSH
jgi:hypothetical protein